MYYIYSLDENDIPFYIGKTLYPDQRLRKHKQESQLLRTYKEKHINKILKNGGDISISIIDIVENGTEDIWEKYWIEQIRCWGFKIYNLTAGGEGGDNWSGKTHSQLTKDKLSKIMSIRHKNDGSKQQGELNGRSKLLSNQVIEMRNLREEGLSYNILSKMYGVSKPVVIDIIKRKKWNHI